MRMTAVTRPPRTYSTSTEASSKMVAAVGKGRGRGEDAEAEHKEQNVKHHVFPLSYPRMHDERPRSLSGTRTQNLA